MSTQRQPAPGRPVQAVVALVGLQALTLLGIVVFYVVELFVSTPDSLVSAVVSAALMLAAGLGLLLVARGLARGRRWSRAPALVTQLLLLPVAWSGLDSDRWWLGLGLLVWTGAIAVLLFNRVVSAHLAD